MRQSAGDWTFSRLKNKMTVAKQKTERKVKPVRTRQQMLQRVRLGNMVAMWAAFKGKMKPSYQKKDGTVQSDYNHFVSNNLELSRVCLTRNEVKLGACVVQEYQVSTGRLEPIEVSMEAGGKMRTDLSLGELELTAETTVQEFSNAIIANNPDHDFLSGDQISCFIVTQRTSGSDNLPRVHVTTSRVVLNTNDVRKLYEVVNPAGFGVVDGCLGTKSAVNGGIAWIHTSKKEGCTAVSTQRLVVNNDLLANYTNTDAINRAIESYGGINQEEYLTPDLGGDDEIAQP